MRKLFSSLGAKFVVLVIAILSITLGVTTSLVVKSQNKVFAESLDEKGKLLGYFASLISPEAILAYDFATLNQTMKDLTHQKDMVYSVVTSKNKSAMSSYVNYKNKFISRALRELKLKKLGLVHWAKVIKQLQANKNIIHFKFPIKSDGDVLGEINIGLSTERMRGLARRALIGQLIANVSIIIFLSICIYFVFKINALKPIQNLMSGSERIAKGELDKPIVVKSTDELGNLTVSFNDMMDNLRISIAEKDKAAAELRDLNKTLEDRVSERTEQLAESEERTRTILETVGEGIVIINAAGFIVSFNKAVKTSFNATENELMGLHASMLLADTQWHYEHQNNGYADEQHGPFHLGEVGDRLEYEGIRTDGKTFPLECVVTRVVLNNESMRIVVLRDIARRKELESQVANAAHKSGMADLATGVLHNIGNVLNSVNVAGEEIAAIARDSKVAGLIKANAMLADNLSRIGEFIANDPKGRLLPNYYIKVGEQLCTEFITITKETESLNEKIQMMRDVISTQQSYARSGYFTEELSVSAIVNDSIRVLETSFFKYNVKLIKNYSKVPKCTIQKSKLAQVLTNLIKNSIEAMDDNDEINREKKVEISIDQKDESHVRIEIRDNGLGIKETNINNIFNHGFTTKKDGHGFGLHTCANSMTEMGGSIKVESEGLGKGATFILEVPIAKDNKSNDTMDQVA